MIRRLFRRLTEFVVTLLLGVTIIFFIVHLAPGDPIYQFLHPDSPPEQRALVIQRLGLDQSLCQQYLCWLKASIVEFEFGYSFYSRQPVGQLVQKALGPTLLLTGLALILGVLLGVLAGVKAALKPGSITDRLLTFSMLVFYSTPTFWLGLVLLQLFAIQLNWLPTDQLVSLFHQQLSPGGKLLDYLRHLVLPVSAMALVIAAGFYRYTRSAMLEALDAPFVWAARARGLPTRSINYKYALRNALLPLISLVGTNFPYLFSGALVIEVVFGLPGLGRLTADAVLSRDYPVIMAATLLGFVAALVGNLLADLVYLIADPRLRQARC